MSPVPLPAPAEDFVTPVNPAQRWAGARYAYEARGTGWILWRISQEPWEISTTYTLVGYAMTPGQVRKYVSGAQPLPGTAAIPGV